MAKPKKQKFVVRYTLPPDEKEKTMTVTAMSLGGAAGQGTNSLHKKHGSGKFVVLGISPK